MSSPRRLLLCAAAPAAACVLIATLVAPADARLRVLLATGVAALASAALCGALVRRWAERLRAPLAQLTAWLQASGARPAEERGRAPELTGVQPAIEAVNRMVAAAGQQAEESLRAAVEAARADGERAAAARVQATLIPHELPRRREVELAALSETAREAGGDFYDLLALDGGRLLLAVGDASGKGLPAALLAVQCVTMLRSFCRRDPPEDGEALARVLAQANEMLLETDELGEAFATVCLCLLDTASRRLTIANAGHLPPTLLRGDAATRPLAGEGSFPLGVLSDISTAKESVALERGDAVVLVSDGVPDAVDAAGEYYTQARLDECLLRCRGKRAEEIVRHVRESVRAFAGRAEPCDDMTLLVLRMP